MINTSVEAPVSQLLEAIAIVGSHYKEIFNEQHERVLEEMEKLTVKSWFFFERPANALEKRQYLLSNMHTYTKYVNIIQDYYNYVEMLVRTNPDFKLTLARPAVIDSWDLQIKTIIVDRIIEELLLISK